MKKTASLLLGLIFSAALFAQEAIKIIETVDVVVLVNGDKYKGKVIEENEDFLIIHTKGINFKIVKEAIKDRSKTIEVRDEKSLSKANPFEFRTNRFTCQAGIGMLSDQNHNGVAAQLKAHFLFNQFIGLGLGAGLDRYEGLGSEQIIPLTVELMGFVTDTRIAPFYSLGVGYGIALKDRDSGIIDAAGGVLFNPLIGVRIHGDSGMNLDFFVGYKFQKARFEHSDFFWGTEAFTQLSYKRLQVGIGFSF